MRAFFYCQNAGLRAPFEILITAYEGQRPNAPIRLPQAKMILKPYVWIWACCGIQRYRPKPPFQISPQRKQ